MTDEWSPEQALLDAQARALLDQARGLRPGVPPHLQARIDAAARANPIKPTRYLAHALPEDPRTFFGAAWPETDRPRDAEYRPHGCTEELIAAGVLTAVLALGLWLVLR